MNFQPIIQAPLAVQLHVATIVLAFFLGTWLMFISRKGKTYHKKVGNIFLGLIVTTALISLFIHRKTPDSIFFGFSSTHLLVPIALILAFSAIYRARKGHVKHHVAIVCALYFGAIIFIGISNALNDGITHDIFFN